MKNVPDGQLSLFAVAAPGLEPVLGAELAALGITGAVEDGGVAWHGSAESMMRANLHSRVASRIIVRAGAFKARTFHELERHAARIPWTRYLPAGSTAELRVTTRKSKLYHQGAVAERIARILADQVGVQTESASGTSGTSATGSDEAEAGDAQLIVVRFIRDACTISIDSSGVLLHQRGYRQAISQAPLRETIAAAMLLGSGWRGVTPLIDPMCGSGTIAIEAALIARNIAPGLASADRLPRAYAFERWPGYEGVVFDWLVHEARAAIRPEAGVAVHGNDRHGGAITAARSNAVRAGVGDDIEFERRAVADLAPPPGTGHLVTNPPYGVRVGDRRELTELYSALGRVARERLTGWTLAMLAAEERLFLATGLALTERFATSNGGIPVRLLTTDIP
jgi:putative N6-adenine-specific DNA methylase